MKRFIYVGVLTLLILGAAVAPNAYAESASTTTMLEQIKALMAKLEELQKQLATIRGEIKEVIRNGIAEGMEGDDVRTIQELLATDPTIYPQGKITGYFGPLTKDAIKRFQERHGLTVSGTIDEETRDLLEEYLKERFGDDIPPGLLRAPGIMKKVEDRYRLGCDKHGHGLGVLCKKLHEDDDDEDEDEDEFDVEVETEDGVTTVSFKIGSTEYDVEVDSTTLGTVLDAVADAIKDGDTSEDLDEDLADAIEEELSKENDDENAKEDAQDAIDDAQIAIDEAQEAIDNASGDTSDAEDLLELAEHKIEIAKDAFDDEKYADAERYAERAEDFADDAEDAL